MESHKMSDSLFQNFWDVQSKFHQWGGSVREEGTLAGQGRRNLFTHIWESTQITGIKWDGIGLLKFRG